MPDAVITKAALARELSLSKPAVTNYVRRGMPVRPDGRLNRREALAWIRSHVDPHHASKGAAVASAVQRRTTARGTDDELPAPYRTILKCRSEHHAAACFGALQMLYRMPASAASLAVASGASIPSAFALYRALIIAAIPVVAEVAELAEDEVWIDTRALHDIDWPVLAATVGATFDAAECEAHVRATFGESADAPQRASVARQDTPGSRSERHHFLELGAVADVKQT